MSAGDIDTAFIQNMACWRYGFVQPEEGAETAKDDGLSVLVRPMSKHASVACPSYPRSS